MGKLQIGRLVFAARLLLITVDRMKKAIKRVSIKEGLWIRDHKLYE